MDSESFFFCFFFVFTFEHFKESLLLSLTSAFSEFFHIKVQSLWQGLGMTIRGLEGDGGLVAMIGWLLPVE